MKAFQQLDKDGSGTLTAEEVAAAIGMTGRMSESEVREMIERYDCNGNGVIDFAEFLEVGFYEWVWVGGWVVGVGGWGGGGGAPCERAERCVDCWHLTRIISHCALQSTLSAPLLCAGHV